MNFKLKPSQKRFLIIYLLINAFALMTNLFSLDWSIYIPEYPIESLGNGIDSRIDNYYIFTEGLRDSNWPFVNFYTNTWEDNYQREDQPIYTEFSGIFYDYGLKSFLLMTIIGLSILYLPRFIKSENNKETS